jgi:hypothetical protein
MATMPNFEIAQSKQLVREEVQTFLSAEAKRQKGIIYMSEVLDKVEVK